MTGRLDGLRDEHIAAKAGELGEPLAAAQRLLRYRGGGIGYLEGVALEHALRDHGWSDALVSYRGENYDRMSGPLSTGTSAASDYRHPDHPDVIVRVKTWENHRTGGRGAELRVLTSGCAPEAAR